MPALTVFSSSSHELVDAEELAWACDLFDQDLTSRGQQLGIEVLVPGDPVAHQALVVAGLGVPDSPEAFVLLPPDSTRAHVRVIAADPVGAMYAVLELVDVLRTSERGVEAVKALAPSEQRPAARVRSIMRTFVSDVEDLPWFLDRDFWTDYLTELALARVNRFHLCLGIQYNFPFNAVTENYFCFAYPFLVEVPGYDVTTSGVSSAERQRNLDALRFASDEARRRGITFVLGLWSHGYDEARAEGSEPVHRVAGLTDADHAPYCRDALTQVLNACPGIGGLTLRAHFEAGIPDLDREGFWRTVLAGVTREHVGRTIEIDLHSKGVDAPLLDVVKGTAQPVMVSAKYLGEHWGLPYHQASIRDKEFRRPDDVPDVWAITGDARRFTRYGYGDFLDEDRDHDVIFRMWAGGQRLLLWGDPALASGYGRLSTLGGALGAELCEPLSFKGRKGTGREGGREVYADPSLALGRADWSKFRYTYRLWGRLLYDPDAEPECWRRLLRAQYGQSAASVEAALAAASRIIPLVTMAHGVGASYSNYWPEMYVDMPIVDGPNVDHYEGDSASPATFAGASSFDPQLFYRVVEFADDLVAGRRDGRYTPLDVVGWLEDLVATAETHLAEFGQPADDDLELRRVAIDVAALAGIGRFFAGKFSAALAHALYERTGQLAHLDRALAQLRGARDALAGVAEVTGVYHHDLAFGHRLSEHGHWADRIPAVDADLEAMVSLRAGASADPDLTKGRAAGSQPDQPLAASRCDRVLSHEPSRGFDRGSDVVVRARVEGAGIAEVVLQYRHLHQGESFESTPMTDAGRWWEATIPAAYTTAPFPLLYYFTVRDQDGHAWIEPGLDRDLANQPYHVVGSHQARVGTASA